MKSPKAARKPKAKAKPAPKAKILQFKGEPKNFGQPQELDRSIHHAVRAFTPARQRGAA